MISLKIVSEFSVVKGNFSSITVDLLPNNLPLRRASLFAYGGLYSVMADMLQKAISAMSLEEEEPLDLRDDPSYRVTSDNEKSLMGRLLNPECQSMTRMIEYMPTVWRVIGRVRGIVLSRDRFQFIFQREEDLQTVLNDRPWSYNHWTLALERWTEHPDEDFLRSMMLWVRIRNIPVNFFTTKTMFKLASEVGLVEEIAYDPKISHTKEYVRVLIKFNVENPLKAERKLTIPGEVVTIKYEYEKIHKRCFHCQRMTHEKIRCPILRRGAGRGIPLGTKPMESSSVQPSPATTSNAELEKWDSRPGFPPLFPELSKQDQKMAMLYISHSDNTERLARIERVKQGILDSKAESSAMITKITRDLEKGKGHVFSFPESTGEQRQGAFARLGSSSNQNETLESDAESGASAIQYPVFSASAMVPTGFHLGPSSEGRVTGNQSSSKSQRRRPPSWKRKTNTKSSNGPISSSATTTVSPPTPMKRKSTAILTSADSKTPKTSDPTVASVLKPLPSQ
ncbi:hypothetical protein HA466_0304890 [Hirschfeldia incana]|nr:hypothetical protein HA466_0304890 [Hirschfeldia incana]